jgi:hypothetical protein
MKQVALAGAEVIRSVVMASGVSTGRKEVWFEGKVRGKEG